MSKLNQEEKEILETFEAGKLKPSKNAADIQKRHKEYAKAMFQKDARIIFGFLLRIFVGYRNGHFPRVFRTKHWLQAFCINM